MSNEKDIERLDRRIDKGNDRCDTIHAKLNTCLIEIKTSQARIEERLVSAFGELEEGDTAFTTLNTRVAKLEYQQTRWKGTIAAVAVGGTIVMNFIYMGFKTLISYIATKGGGS